MTRRARLAGLSWLVVLVVLVVLGGCAGGAEDPPDQRLEAVVIPETADGFHLDEAASGPLDLEAAAAAGTQEPEQARELLERLDFAEASVRVWTRGGEFHRVLAIRLTPQTVEEYLTAELDVLRATPAATVFDVTDPAGATGVLLAGQTRKGAGNVFCQSVLFPAEAVAFVVQTCSRERPGAPDAVLQLARAQATRAAVAF